VVTYVVDGDTVRVRPPGGGKPLSVRIEGIDAPEICQAGGTASRDALMRRVLGQRVTVHGRRHDDYGRLLAVLTLQGEDTGLWMVRQGLAWSYRHRANTGPYALAAAARPGGGAGDFFTVKRRAGGVSRAVPPAARQLLLMSAGPVPCPTVVSADRAVQCPLRWLE
jgi:micrococcal nuclease